MQITLSIRDGISPALARIAARMQNRRPILMAMGQAVLSHAKQAFCNPQMRPADWPARKRSYSWPILRRTGNLM